MSLSDDEDESSSEDDDDVDSLDAKSDYTDEEEDRDFFDFGSSTGARGSNGAFYGAWLEDEDSVLPVVSPSMTPCRERSEWISRSSLSSSTLSSTTDPAKVGAPTTRARSGTTGRNRSGSNRSRRNEWFPLKSFIDLRSTSDSFDAASSLSVSGLSLGSLPLNPFALQDGESVEGVGGVGQVVTPPPESPGSAGEGGWRWRSFIDVASL